MLDGLLFMWRLKCVVLKDTCKFTYHIMFNDPKSELIYYRLLLKTEHIQNMTNFIKNTQDGSRAKPNIINAVISKEFKEIDNIMEIDYVRMAALRRKALEN